jgi:hypothetical protein
MFRVCACAQSAHMCSSPPLTATPPPPHPATCRASAAVHVLCVRALATCKCSGFFPCSHPSLTPPAPPPRPLRRLSRLRPTRRALRGRAPLLRVPLGAPRDQRHAAPHVQVCELRVPPRMRYDLGGKQSDAFWGCGRARIRLLLKGFWRRRRPHAACTPAPTHPARWHSHCVCVALLLSQ